MIDDHFYSIDFHLGERGRFAEKDTEISLLKRKNDMLNNALCVVEKEKNASQTDIDTLNKKLHTLQTEKEHIIQSAKGLSSIWTLLMWWEVCSSRFSHSHRFSLPQMNVNVPKKKRSSSSVSMPSMDFCWSKTNAWTMN